ncbi:MAG: T9SS type A sorting domain-containing protein [Bacteroidota bacterium]
MAAKNAGRPFKNAKTHEVLVKALAPNSGLPETAKQSIRAYLAKPVYVPGKRSINSTASLFKPDSAYEDAWGNGWFPVAGHVYTYNLQGYETSHVTYEPDFIQAQSMVKTNYDTGGRVLSTTNYMINMATNSLEPYSLDSARFDQFGNPAYQGSFGWNNGAWENQFEFDIVTTYDAQNRIQSFVESANFGGLSLTLSFDFRGYNADGSPMQALNIMDFAGFIRDSTLLTFHSWHSWFNPEYTKSTLDSQTTQVYRSGDWVDSSRDSYTYSANESTIQTNYLSMPAGGLLQPVTQYTNLIDSHGNATFDAYDSLYNNGTIRVNLSHNEYVNRYNAMDALAQVITLRDNFGSLDSTDRMTYTHFSDVESVKPSLASGINAYPNPFNNSFTVSDFNTQAFTSWQLSDLGGRIVSEGSKGALVGSITVPAAGLSRGMYLLSVSNGNKVLKTIKLVKTESN